jgi:hypothetical protein
MKIVIHKTKEDAQEACEKYDAEVEKLAIRLGVTSVNTSTCGDTFSTAEYFNDSSGATEEFWNMH